MHYEIIMYIYIYIYIYVYAVYIPCTISKYN